MITQPLYARIREKQMRAITTKTTQEIKQIQTSKKLKQHGKTSNTRRRSPWIGK